MMSRSYIICHRPSGSCNRVQDRKELAVSLCRVFFVPSVCVQYARLYLLIDRITVAPSLILLRSDIIKITSCFGGLYRRRQLPNQYNCILEQRPKAPSFISNMMFSNFKLLQLISDGQYWCITVTSVGRVHLKDAFLVDIGHSPTLNPPRQSLVSCSLAATNIVYLLAAS